MMRHTITAVTVTILAAALVTIGIGPVRAQQALDCGFDFSPSRPDVRPPQIMADALGACDTPPDTHTAIMDLEYRQGSQWVVASTRTDNSIPPPYREGGHHYSVSAACYAGIWRGAVHIRGGIQGHTFRYDSTSDTVEVPDSQCHPRF